MACADHWEGGGEIDHDKDSKRPKDGVSKFRKRSRNTDARSRLLRGWIKIEREMNDDMETMRRFYGQQLGWIFSVKRKRSIGSLRRIMRIVEEKVSQILADK